MAGQAELVVDAQALLGEGPHWDHTAARLYWVNIEGKQLRSYDPKTKNEKIYTFDKKISAVVPAAAAAGYLHCRTGYTVSAKMSRSSGLLR
nr:SMP-30/gluconolactonase/LRE family protein [Paenibacillus ihuae]